MKATKVRFMTFTLITLFAISIFYVNSCDDGPTEPKLEPGRRDYVWEIDTLKLINNDFLWLSRMWANSTNDVWAIGGGNWTGNNIWHYDGKGWSTDSISRGIEGGGIYGFGSNDVWIGTAEGVFWHFDGNNWREFQKLSLDGFDRINIENIFGTAYNNIFAVGFAGQWNGPDYKAIIVKFNGLRWEFVNIPGFKLSFVNIRKAKNSNYYLINGFSEEIYNNIKLLKFDGKNVTMINESDYSTEVYELNGSLYITMNRKIYKENNNKLVVWKDFSAQTFGYGIYGKNEKDFFSFVTGYVHGKDMIGHFNGSDFQVLLNTNFHFTGAGAYIDNNVFVTAFDDLSNSSVIIHGKLKE